MESTRLYEDDLTEERMPTPEQREQNEHAIALDPDVDDDVDDDDDDDDDYDEGEDLDD